MLFIKNIYLLQVFLCLLFAGPALALDLSSKIKILSKHCHAKHPIAVKKILIVLVKDKSFVQTGKCSEKLTFLLKSCREEFNCKSLHQLAVEFNSDSSSNVIGE